MMKVELGNPDGKVETAEQATKIVVEMCNRVVKARADCNVVIPDDPETTAKLQTQAYQRWLMTYGQAFGQLIAYYQCGKLSDEAYRRLKNRVQATLAVSVVGAAHGLSMGRGIPDLGS